MFIKIIAIALSVSLLPFTPVKAVEIVLPKPGAMLALTPSFSPAVLKGIKVHVNDPLRLEFIVAQGNDDNLAQEESSKLVKYFLASLATPEKDMWVNLSPYEKDRIVPNSFGQTEMGRDLLAQDYILKQITASLVYPENEIGKEFWRRVYQEASRKSVDISIPINTFNKVWIMPDKAVIQENVKTGTAYIKEATLKVMLEVDYLSTKKHVAASTDSATEIVRQMVIPQLTKEVNEGAHFAGLRQMYHAFVLAAWYKRKIQNSVLSGVYVDQNKTQGVTISNPFAKQEIYEQYLQAFKKGVFNYIKEESDPVTHQLIPKKYFSGGLTLNISQRLEINKAMTAAEAVGIIKQGLKLLTISVALTGAFTKPALAQVEVEDRPVFASSKDERDYELVMRLQERGLNGELAAIKRLEVLYRDNNISFALKALGKIAFSGDAQNSKSALELFLKSSLSSLKDFETLRSAIQLAHPESKDALIKFVESGNLDASFYLLRTSLTGDVKTKAMQNILAFLKRPDRFTSETQWTTLRIVLLEEFGRDKSNALIKEILQELAYLGTASVSSQVIESGLVELDSKRLVDSAKRMGSGDISLMKYYQHFPSKELLRSIIRFLFEADRQTLNLRGILADYNITKEILESPEFKDREPPEGNGFHRDSILILAAAGHRKSHELAEQHYSAGLVKYIYDRLYLTALKGELDSVSKLEEMAQDDDNAAIEIIYNISRNKSASDLIKQRFKSYIEDNVDLFKDLFDKGTWQEFGKDPKHKAIVDGLYEDVKTDPKVLVILYWLGLLTKEHIAYHPFSQDVIDALGSRLIDGLELYFSYDENPNELFRILAKKWGGYVVSNLMQPFRNVDKLELKKVFLKSLSRMNILEAMGYLKDDKEKLQLIVYALQENIPEAWGILKEYVQHNHNRAEYLYGMYVSGFISFGDEENKFVRGNIQIKDILANVDMSTFKTKDFFQGLDPEISQFIRIGNLSILDVALKLAITRPRVAEDLQQMSDDFPKNLRDYIKDMKDISPYKKSESLMRMFVLLGNKPAISELLKGFRVEEPSLINTVYLESYNDPRIQAFKNLSRTTLAEVRAQNISAFKEGIRNMSPKEGNEYMLKLYLSALYDIQDQFNLLDFEIFKEIAVKMIARISLSVTLNNANSGFEFGFNLLLRLNSIDELLFVLHHELAHNVLDAKLLDRKIDRFKLDQKKKVQVGSIHEYFSDIVAYAASQDDKKVARLFDDNFLCDYCRAVNFSDFKLLQEEVHVIPRTSLALFRFKAKAKGIDTAKFFAELFKNHREKILNYSGDYTNFNDYFIYTLALQLGVTYTYDPSINLSENLDRLLDLPVPNKAMAAIDGGIDFNTENLNLVNPSAGAQIHFNVSADLLKQYNNVAGFIPTIKAVQPLVDLNSFLNL